MPHYGTRYMVLPLSTYSTSTKSTTITLQKNISNGEMSSYTHCSIIGKVENAAGNYPYTDNTSTIRLYNTTKSLDIFSINSYGINGASTFRKSGIYLNHNLLTSAFHNFAHNIAYYYNTGSYTTTVATKQIRPYLYSTETITMTSCRVTYTCISMHGIMFNTQNAYLIKFDNTEQNYFTSASVATSTKTYRSITTVATWG